MPYSLEADETIGVLSVTASGTISGTELLQLHSELAGQGGQRDRCLLDFTAADVSQVGGPMVRELAALPPRFERLAIVARAGPAFGLGRMYQSSVPDRAIGVFMTRDNAIAWLLKGANPPHGA